MSTHTRLRIGAVALVLLLVVLLSGAHLCAVAQDPGSRPLATGALACTEFWLNRYQTMIGACVALYAGWLALRGAKGQIEVAKLQLPLAQKQADAVRADRISALIGSTFELAAVISDFDDQVYRGWGSIEVVRGCFNFYQDPSKVLTLNEMDTDKINIVHKYFAEADAIIERLDGLMPYLRKASDAGLINPMLEIAPQCANILINSVGQLKYSLSILRRVSRASREEIKIIIAAPYRPDINWNELQPMLNVARGEMEDSIEKLRAQLFVATRGIID